MLITDEQKRLAALPLAERLRLFQNPVHFIRNCITTRDEVNAKEPLRLAPMTEGLPGYKPYLEPIIKVWRANPMMIIDKSRRMWVSYLCLSLQLHLSFTRPDGRIGIMSKKFEDAVFHLDNIRKMYELIPEELYPAACRPTLKYKEGLIYFEEIDTYIHALAAGPDQARQYGFSSIFADEFAFTENQELTYAALAPTLQNGGKLLIATTHPLIDTGEEIFYRRLLEDRL